MAGTTPVMVSIGPIKEWDHLGMMTLIPGTRQLLVPSQYTDCLSLVSLDELSVIGTAKLPEGSAPWNAVATPDRKQAYVTNGRFSGHIDKTSRENSTVSVIDLDSFKVVGDIPVGAHPAMIEMDERRGRAYVTNQGSNTVTVISLEAGEPIETIRVGAAPHWVRLSPKGDLLVVGNFEDASLSLIDPDKQETLNTITVGTAKLKGAYSEFGPGDTVGFSISSEGIAYVANWRSNTIVTVDIYAGVERGQRAVGAAIQTLKLPFTVGLFEELNLLVVGSYDAGESRFSVHKFDCELKENGIGRELANVPADGTVIPSGEASAVNYWMSQPFENRIIGFLPQGPNAQIPDMTVAIL